MKRFAPITTMLMLLLFIIFGWGFGCLSYKLSTDSEEVFNQYVGSSDKIQQSSTTNYKTGVTAFALISSVCFISAALIAVKTHNDKPQV